MLTMLNTISTKEFTRNLLLLTALFCLLASPISTTEAALFKWVDETGQIRYGDRIPARYAKKRSETLNSQGVVLNTQSAEKTQQQLVEEKNLAAIRAEVEKVLEKKAHQDRILLDTFATENEIVVTRDRKTEAVEAVINITNDRIHKARSRLLAQTRRAANMERSGHAIPDNLKKGISDTRNQIKQNLSYIDNRKIEQQAIREKHDLDIKRFRVLLERRAERASHLR